MSAVWVERKQTFHDHTASKGLL